MNTLKTPDIESLYHDLLKWYYDKEDRSKSMAVAVKLEKAISASPRFSRTIRGEEIRSIIAELRDELPDAIQSREAEIRKILELHARCINTPDWEYVRDQYGYDDVSDRLDLLAILYDKQGDLDRAIAVLHESKDYCEGHRIPFDGQDILDELEASGDGAPLPDPPSRALDAAIRTAYRRFGYSADEIVIAERRSREFASNVNRTLAGNNKKVSTQDVKRRLLVLRKRSATRGGLPKLKR